ncbi:MAG: pectate lyase [Prolixibacteraceae bacterium]|jgi:PelA/Pel-15E family pectate lyase|nr:pectate lyase [Prolixibacteraceae bacterium]
MIQKTTLSLFILFSFSLVYSQTKIEIPKNDEERTGWSYLLHQQNNWYNSNEAIRIANNILLLQRNYGGWPKNIDMTRVFTKKELITIHSNKNKKGATIDNASTYTHLRYLAKIYQATKSNKYKIAFITGFDYLLEAQYENGGWPQFYPPKKGYSSHITFNDDAMTGVMYLLKDIADKQIDFTFLTEEQFEAAAEAVQRGIEVILKTQIEIDGLKTGWCAQHDEFTFQPADARSYELASISGKETVTIIEFLMSIEKPTQAIKEAIVSTCQWFENSKITGYKLTYIPDSNAAEGFNRILVENSNGPDLWARFYNIETGKPLWVDRGGIIVENHIDISPERRNNYAYVEQFAHKLLHTEFPEWKKENGIELFDYR